MKGTVALLLLSSLASGRDPVDVNVTSGRTVSTTVTLKDPFIAGMLSAQIPGSGQIYNGSWLKGAAFAGLEVGAIALGSSFLGQKTVTDTFYVRSPSGYNYVFYDHRTESEFHGLSGWEKAGVVGLFVGAVGLHVLNILDAYRGAVSHNDAVQGYSRLELAPQPGGAKLVYRF